MYKKKLRGKSLTSHGLSCPTNNDFELRVIQRKQKWTKPNEFFNSSQLTLVGLDLVESTKWCLCFGRLVSCHKKQKKQTVINSFSKGPQT